MERLPVRDRSCRPRDRPRHLESRAFRRAVPTRAVDEAARVAKPGAGLFVFTFSRHTLPAETLPVAGEPFVFTQFSGEPQCFLTESPTQRRVASRRLRAGSQRAPPRVQPAEAGNAVDRQGAGDLRGLVPPRLTYTPNVTTSPRADVAWRTGPSTCLFWRRGW